MTIKERMMKKLIDIIWEQIERNTITVHKTKGKEQHIYSICGIIDKKQLEKSLEKWGKGEMGC